MPSGGLAPNIFFLSLTESCVFGPGFMNENFISLPLLRLILFVS